jgi:succinyl-CoA synthetase alpha subunit
VQGITGRYGSVHTKFMLDYGTNIVAGVTPGNAGQSVHGIPVFNRMKEAVAATSARITIAFVPAQYLLGAALEAIEAGIHCLVIITEHVPIRDSLTIFRKAKENECIVIGPNTAGVIIPNRIKLGIMPASPFTKGNIAIFSRSGTLTYEIAYQLSNAGLGQSIALGVGGDPINCTSLVDCLEWVRNHDGTDAVVIIGEIGGDAEERLAKHIHDTQFPKPVLAYIAGRHAPKEKKMGHAGAIIYGSYGTAESKIKAFNDVGVRVAKKPEEVPQLVNSALRR